MSLSQIKITNPIEKRLSNKCLIDDEGLNNYDYEVFDEEVIQNSKQKIELTNQIKNIEQDIQNNQKQLESLKQKLKNLN